MASSTNSCAFDGDDNLYGQGIRLGQYFLWFAFVIAAVQKPSKMSPIMTTLTIFQLAVIAAVIWKVKFSAQTKQVINIDIVIATQFAYWQSLVSYIHFFQEQRPVPLLFSIFFLLVACVVSVFNVWLWFVGINDLAEPPCNAVVSFFFVRVSLDSWLPIFAKVMTAADLAVLSLVLLGGLFFMLYYCRREGFQQLLGQLNKRTPEKDLDTEILSRTLRLIKWILAAISIMITIATIELTIEWNNIENVRTLESTGQTIPFIIGLVSFLGVIFSILIPKYLERSSSSDATEAELT